MPYNALHLRHLHDQYARSALACRERSGLDQSTPDGMRPAQQMCVRCGRVTARRDDRGLPWCGGLPVTEQQRRTEVWPGQVITP